MRKCRIINIVTNVHICSTCTHTCTHAHTHTHRHTHAHTHTHTHTHLYVLSLAELCTSTKKNWIPVFYIHTSVKFGYTNWCGRGVLAFHFFPTDELSNNKGWWHFICIAILGTSHRFDNRIALFAYSDISINVAVCLSFTLLEVFPQIWFPFGTKVHLISCVSDMLMRRSSFASQNLALSDMLSRNNYVYTGTENHTDILCCLLNILVKPVNWHKPLALFISVDKRNEEKRKNVCGSALYSDLPRRDLCGWLALVKFYLLCFDGLWMNVENRGVGNWERGRIMHWIWRMKGAGIQEGGGGGGRRRVKEFKYKPVNM